MKSNATTYRVEGELRDWVRDYARFLNISQTTLVRGLLSCVRESVAKGKCEVVLVDSGGFRIES